MSNFDDIIKELTKSNKNIKEFSNKNINLVVPLNIEPFIKNFDNLIRILIDKNKQQKQSKSSDELRYKLPVGNLFLPMNQNFFEGQEGLGCGRHALNNLLGNRFFCKGTTKDKDFSKLPISVLGICSYYDYNVTKYSWRTC